MAGGLVGLAFAQDDTDEPVDPAEETSRQADIGACGECHPDVVAAWQNGPHDLAYSDPVFQAGWAAQRNDPACLDCHTTGYSPATGEYTAEGVTCEACHGEAPGEHPPAPVDLSQANAVCSECHTITQAEFRASMHDVAGLACTSCHYAHTNGLRMDTELEQCLNCHGASLGGFVAHTTHINNGLSCRDCHGYVRPGGEIPPDGLAPTGHDFQENLVACLDCHEDIQLEPVGETDPCEDLVPGDLTGQQAVVRATQLEAAVQTLILQNRNQSVMNLVEGGAGGLLIGGVVVWLLARRRNGSNKKNGEGDEGK
jgi:hypothetical protein